MQYYECGDFPFNFVFVNMDLEDVNAEKVAQEINTWLDNLPPGKTPNWVLGNHDRKRLGTRLGTQLIDIFNMISLTLPGTYNIIIIKYMPIPSPFPNILCSVWIVLTCFVCLFKRIPFQRIPFQRIPFQRISFLRIPFQRKESGRPIIRNFALHP